MSVATPSAWFAQRDPIKLEAALNAFTTDQPQWIRQHNNDAYFALWMWLVNTQVRRLCGFTIYDLPDWRFHDAYTEGYSPAQAARELIEDNHGSW